MKSIFQALTSNNQVAVPEYLIITSESLKDAFQLLADWKIKKGTPTIIETVENIVGKYRGADTQEKIRNYLIDIKSRYGSLFVLLGGDTNIIPARLKKTRLGRNWGKCCHRGCCF